LYGDAEIAERAVPLLSLLSTATENLKNRAERLAPQIEATAAVERAQAIADVTFLGGGSVPTQEIPTWCVAITPKEMTVSQLAKALRAGEPAVFGRVHQDRLLLDLRSVFPHQDLQLASAFNSVEGRGSKVESQGSKVDG
jgi:L-seryl-tRNA(Ser) seleniumtransferase